MLSALLGLSCEENTLSQKKGCGLSMQREAVLGVWGSGIQGSSGSRVSGVEVWGRFWFNSVGFESGRSESHAFLLLALPLLLEILVVLL